MAGSSLARALSVILWSRPLLSGILHLAPAAPAHKSYSLRIAKSLPAALLAHQFSTQSCLIPSAPTGLCQLPQTSAYPCF